MNKIAISFFVLALGFSACNKSNQNSGCAANQVCTAEFASLGVEFVDKDGNNVTVKDIVVTNLRSDTAIVVKNALDPGFSPNVHTIATDANKNEFSAKGDMVKVTATNTATNKIASAMFLISGGCNCHISKLSGPEKIVFE